jgi:hypothetical protein
MTNDAIYCLNQSSYQPGYNSTRNKTFFDSYRILQDDLLLLDLYRVSFYFIPTRELESDLNWKAVVDGSRDP